MSVSGARGLEEKEAELLQAYGMQLQVFHHVLQRSDSADLAKEKEIVENFAILTKELEEYFSQDRPLKEKDAKLTDHQSRVGVIRNIIDAKYQELEKQGRVPPSHPLNTALMKIDSVVDALAKARKHYASLKKPSEVKAPVLAEQKVTEVDESKLLQECKHALRQVYSAFDTMDAEVEAQKADEMEKEIDRLRESKEKSEKVAALLAKLEGMKNQHERGMNTLRDDPVYQQNRPSVSGGEDALRDYTKAQSDELSLELVVEQLRAAITSVKKLQSLYGPPPVQKVFVEQKVVAAKEKELVRVSAAQETEDEKIYRVGKICSACSDVVSNALCDHIAKLHNKRFSECNILDGKVEHMVSRTLFSLNKELAKTEISEGTRYKNMERLAKAKLLKLAKGNEQAVERMIGDDSLESAKGMSKEAQFLVAMLNAKRDAAKLHRNVELVFSGKLDPNPGEVKKSAVGKFFEKVHILKPKAVSATAVAVKDKEPGRIKRFFSEKNPLKKIKNPLKEVEPLAKRRERPALGAGMVVRQG